MTILRQQYLIFSGWRRRELGLRLADFNWLACLFAQFNFLSVTMDFFNWVWHPKNVTYVKVGRKEKRQRRISKCFKRDSIRIFSLAFLSPLDEMISDSYVPWITPSTSFFFVWNYFMSNIDLFQIDVFLFGTLILRPTFQESFPSTLLVISHEASKITAYSRLFLFCCFCKGNHVLTYFFLFLFVLFSYCSLCLHFVWICATRPSQLL